ncbi:hypothetical protein C8046_08545 [Serinibacter arcticus]|uniref:Uncharacterized protein n=1 Tax=Serinibacter arcticus TaxID=1655435 RepID=A0A2U1ZUN9_9MICO|nr:hypothetical protein [Serinibacter arcticus]PWD50694.1 hypothetical protein C8046_08545 [Serinibacter arcticus]
MSITAMQMPLAQPVAGRPVLRMLPELRDEQADVVVPGRRPLNLDEVRAEADLVARRACRTVGVRGTWGTSRWRATEDPETVVSTFQIRVAGKAPCADVAQSIAGRLATNGWTSRVKAMTPIVRIDAERDGFRLRLVATGGTVTVRVTGRPITVGEKLAQRVLDGVFEED